MVRLVLKEMGIEKVGFIVNKLNMEMIRKGFAPDVSEIVRGFQRELLGVIQSDENISISTVSDEYLSSVENPLVSY